MTTDIQKLQNFLNPNVGTWLQDLRQQGLQNFEKLGWPTAKQEAWKYTSLKSIAETNFQLAPEYQANGAESEELRCLKLGHLDGIRLSFVNGRFAEDFSNIKDLPDGVSIRSLKQAMDQNPKMLGMTNDSLKNPMAALNTALLQDGAYVHVAKNVVLEKPIELLFLSLPNGSALMNPLRNKIVVESGAQVCIVESYAGKPSSTPYFTNALTEITTLAGASASHYKIQEENQNAFHWSALSAEQSRDSNFQSYQVSLGGSLSRHEIVSQLRQEGAQCKLHGLYLAEGKQHMDQQTLIDHQKPHGTSHELYKGILDEESRGIFNGQIKVHPHAQKTNSSLTNNNLLLSKTAKIDTKPLLEIFADDVKCSHGATIGRLDEAQVFYLRSRGINEKLARNLLTYAFAAEVLESMEVKPIREHVSEILRKRLGISSL